MHSCPICGREFSNKGNLGRHEEAHTRKGETTSDVPRETSAGTDDTVAGDTYNPQELTPGGVIDLGGDSGGGPAGSDGAPPRKGLGAIADKVKGATARAKARAKTKPARSTGKRESLADLGGGAVGWLGRRVESAGEKYLREGRYGERPIYASVMVGRSVDLISPVAGELMDDALAGTMLDRVAQPLVAKRDEWEKVFRVLEIPVLIGMAERHPEALYVSVDDNGVVTVEGPLAQPLCRAVLVFLEAHADVVVKKKKDEAATRKKIAEAFGDFEGDPVMTIIADLFRPVEGVTVRPPNADVEAPVG